MWLYEEQIKLFYFKNITKTLSSINPGVWQPQQSGFGAISLALAREKKLHRKAFVQGAVSRHDAAGRGHHVKDLAKADSNPRASTVTRPFLGGRAASPRTQAASRGTLATPKTEF